jgi:tRNA (cmo5U34)-methyltransferase
VERCKPLNRDETFPEGKWKFDEAVTEVFDNMLERSIPDYDGMRRTTTELAVRYAKPQTAIIDLGCSRGAALKPIYKILGDSVSYFGIEVSEPMRNAAKAEIPFATILDTDLRTSYPPIGASVTLSVLTLQFIPIEYRQQIIQRVFDTTIQGGAFLLVEKVLGSDSFTNQMLIETYLNRKGQNGYTAEQIQRKRESLEGVLVPVTADWNVQLLRSAGFKNVECYWRHLNFAAWIGFKN